MTTPDELREAVAKVDLPKTLLWRSVHGPSLDIIIAALAAKEARILQLQEELSKCTQRLKE